VNEYRIIDGSRQEIEMRINELANDGWRVVGLCSVGPPRGIFLWRR
jgi:hypothetical protein